MAEKKELIQQIENKQLLLRKRKQKIKKRIPYFVFACIFFAIGIIGLLDGKLNSVVGNSSNLIQTTAVFVIIILLIYLIIINAKIKNINHQIKELGNKLYDLMKL